MFTREIPVEPAHRLQSLRPAQCLVTRWLQVPAKQRRGGSNAGSLPKAPGNPLVNIAGWKKQMWENHR